MTTTSSDNAAKYVAPSEKTTVAQPEAPTITPVVTGTLGRSGVVEYTKATPKVINETYAVTKK